MGKEIKRMITPWRTMEKGNWLEWNKDVGIGTIIGIAEDVCTEIDNQCTSIGNGLHGMYGT